MSVTPEIEAEVLKLYNANAKRFSPFKVAKSAGISMAEVLSVVNKHKATVTDGTEHNSGEGRADLQPYIVAKRRVVGQQWDNDDPGIAAARAGYAAGTHDMATHRDGAWLFLCSFPLQKPRPARPNYFQMGAV